MNNYLKVYNTTNYCVPVFDEATGSLFLPLTNSCTNCQNAKISLAGPTVPVSGCEEGFSVKAGKSSLATWKKLIVKLSYQNPDNLAVSVLPNSNSYFNNSNNPNLCLVVVPSGATPITSLSGTIGYRMGNVVYFEFCAPQLNSIPNSVSIFDIVANGLGCLKNVQFEMETKFELWDNQGICSPQNMSQGTYPASYCTPCTHFSIQGSIKDYNGDGVKVPLGPISGVYFQAQTYVGFSCFTPPLVSSPCNIGVDAACNGDYNIPITDNANCPEANLLTITPYNDDNFLQGVSTFDLVLLSKHILGVDPFTSPYQWISANVDLNPTLSTFDLVHIRKRILHIHEDWHSGGINNTSWRFVEKDFVFAHPANPPLDINEMISKRCLYQDINNSGGEDIVFDFIAMKTGDVNGSSHCPGLIGNTAEDRSQSSAVFYYLTDKSAYKKGDDVTVDFYINNTTDLVAWQAGLQFDPALMVFQEAVPTGYEGISTDNFGLTETATGKVRVLWYEEHGMGMQFTGQEKLFRLRFKALRDIKGLESILSINDEVMYSVTYEPDGRPGSLRLEYKASEAELPNLGVEHTISVATSPNPFSEELRMSISLQEAGYLDVSIYDALGRMVATWNEYTEPGFREVQFKDTSRWSSGIYTWLVKTDKKSVTGKVVKK